MYDVMSFGEAMVRLSPPNFLRLEQTTSLDVRVGGHPLAGFEVTPVGRFSTDPRGGACQRVLDRSSWNLVSFLCDW